MTVQVLDGLTPFCARCKEEFPIAKEPATWRMGFLRRLSKLPRRLREHHEIAHQAGGYLCGNCYFDLTDEE
ncbi:MAG: hypothetical protein Q8O40_12650 [Chloroflexota bacterium]|nr:hypothetical protein [Chloroflexota bacterium]